MPASEQKSAKLRVLLLSIPLIVGIVEAVRSAWVCDDVFISFRYVEHLIRGEGLVFNAGERVEGYTHFLWVLILWLFRRFGCDLVTVGRYLPILAFALLLLLLFRRSMNYRGPAWMGLPVAAWCVALHRDAQVYASSGLETSFFALLILSGLLCLAVRSPNIMLAAVLYALAALTRPEGALVTLVAGVYVLWRWKALKPIVNFSVTWLLLVSPMLVFRFFYYGQWLPNTFYAKSGGSTYWSQGWRYVEVYFSIYWVLLFGLLAIIVGLFYKRRGPASQTASLQVDHVALLAGIQAVVYIVYVLRVGGDFMFARFLIPITPLLYLSIEEVVRRSQRRWVEIVFAVLLPAATLYARVDRANTFPGRQRFAGISNEANYYTRDLVTEYKRQGLILGKALQGTDARLGLLSGQDAIAYFGSVSYALEPHGLTDSRLARQKIETRGRPGHEKNATLEDLLRRKVHLRLRYGLTVNLPMHKQLRIGDLYGELVYYDAHIMSQLRRKGGINFIEFPVFLDAYMKKIENKLPQRLLNDYIDFQLFYFAHNSDPLRLAQLRSALVEFGIPELNLQQADEHVAETLRRIRS